MNMSDMMINMIMGMFGKNPLFQQAQKMAQGKSEQEIMNTINNLCSSNGLNINEMKQRFDSEVGTMFKGMNR